MPSRLFGDVGARVLCQLSPHWHDKLGRAGARRRPLRLLERRYVGVLAGVEMASSHLNDQRGIISIKCRAKCQCVFSRKSE